MRAGFVAIGVFVARSALAATQPPIFAFNSATDGIRPQGGLIADAAGNLYGATLLGGAACSFNPDVGCGVVFQMSPPSQGGGAWTETVLHSFTHYVTGGAEPAGGVIRDAAGNLYGTTVFGGQTGLGAVFRLRPPGSGQTGWTETILHSFAGSGDGASPQAGLVLDKSGALYGTTYYQNGNGGCGTVFQLTSPGAGKTAWKQATLYSFTGAADGCQPQASMTFGASGALYGTTTSGGSGNAGSVFQLTPPSAGSQNWTQTTVFDFPAGSGGSGTGGGVAMDAQGAIYVMTALGGAGACPGGCGQVYKLSPNSGAWTPTIIYTFQGAADGRHPVGTLAFDAAGNLYGATKGRRQAPGGTVFRLAPPTSGTQWAQTTLYHFQNAGDGAAPTSGVYLDTSSTIFGTMSYGGTYGAIFGVAP